MGHLRGEPKEVARPGEPANRASLLYAHDEAYLERAATIPIVFKDGLTARSAIRP